MRDASPRHALLVRPGAALRRVQHARSGSPVTPLAPAERVAFIGSAGVPNRYGGFEAFLEHCAPVIGASCPVVVTCDARLYAGERGDFDSVARVFLPIPANGAWSVLHDLLAFAAVFRGSTHIVVLGVSGAPWFPLFRFMCALSGKTLIVNVDGVEWRRAKFGLVKRAVLWIFEAVAQLAAHRIVVDNPGLLRFVLRPCRSKAQFIPYSGDHAPRAARGAMVPGTALTVCRIEPENNIELLIEGALASRLSRYTIVGNWQRTAFARALWTRYRRERRVQLLEPIYEPTALARIRERCSIYLHGHSVGGTNPSLVEMMFYDCDIVAYDCEFNRHTAGSRATYFGDPAGLTRQIDAAIADPGSHECATLAQYTASHVAARYLQVCRSALRRRRQSEVAAESRLRAHGGTWQRVHIR